MGGKGANEAHGHRARRAQARPGWNFRGQEEVDPALTKPAAGKAVDRRLGEGQRLPHRWYLATAICLPHPVVGRVDPDAPVRGLVRHDVAVPGDRRADDEPTEAGIVGREAVAPAPKANPQRCAYDHHRGLHHSYQPSAISWLLMADG